MLLTMSVFVLWGGFDFAKRSIVTATAHAVIWIFILRELYLSRPRYSGTGHLACALLAGVMVSISVVRLLHAASTGEHYSQQDALFNLMASLGLYWTGFGFTLSLLYIRYEQLMNQLQRKAENDSLTSLLNHRTFQEQAEDVFRFAKREGKALSLLVIDLDHFKRINDRYGHQVGDRVLESLADCLRSEARQSDVIGRCGGEEFGILLPGTGCLEAYNVAERIRSAISSLRVELAPGEEVCITASVGLASDPVHYENLADMFLAADMLLYQAKNKGRNRVEMA